MACYKKTYKYAERYQSISLKSNGKYKMYSYEVMKKQNGILIIIMIYYKVNLAVRLYGVNIEKLGGIPKVGILKKGWL